MYWSLTFAIAPDRRSPAYRIEGYDRYARLAVSITVSRSLVTGRISAQISALDIGLALDAARRLVTLLDARDWRLDASDAPAFVAELGAMCSCDAYLSAPRD